MTDSNTPNSHQSNPQPEPIHNPNSTDPPFPPHLLEPGRSAPIALLAITGAGAARIQWFASDAQLIDAALNRKKAVIKSMTGSNPSDCVIKTVDQAAALLASPAAAFHVIRSAEQLDALIIAFLERCTTLEVAFLQLSQVFDPNGRHPFQSTSHPSNEVDSHATSHDSPPQAPQKGS